MNLPSIVLLLITMQAIDLLIEKEFIDRVSAGITIVSSDWNTPPIQAQGDRSTLKYVA